MIPGPEGHADEAEPALQRHRRHGRERAVAAGDADRVGVDGPGQLHRVVTVLEHARFHAALARRSRQLVGIGPATT